MARPFTTAELALLKSGKLHGRLLTTWYLDSGTYRFCDDPEDCTDGTYTYIGASALFSCTDIASGTGTAAEGITFVVDGTRVLEAASIDPAELFAGILSLNLHQKVVTIAIGLSAYESTTFGLVRTIYTGKTNNAKLVWPQTAAPSDKGTPVAPGPANLQISIDSLAARYGRVTGRTRSHNDQQELAPGDLFFEFTIAAVANSILYWGEVNPVTGAKGAKTGISSGLVGGFVGGAHLPNAMNQF